jgi:Major Facilitator Superfamily
VSWRAAFLLNIPIGAFVVVVSGKVPESRDPTASRRLDARGAVLAAVALGGTTYALIEGPDRGMAAGVVVAGAAGLLALIAFVLAERREANPMLPLGIFASAQFTAANVITFVIYAAIGGFFFLFVSFLQISLGYSPIAAGTASLPVTVLTLLFSARAGVLAQRIGPRIPLTVGPLVMAAGLLWLTRLEPGDGYAAGALPGVTLFGLGLTLVAAPITATVLAGTDDTHAGLASGVNNAVARVANLLAVAVLPLLGGITGESFYDPSAMTDGFHIAMFTCAALATAGGLIAWAAIRTGALDAEPRRRGRPPAAVPAEYSCSVAGPPLRPPAPATATPSRPLARTGGL